MNKSLLVLNNILFLPFYESLDSLEMIFYLVVSVILLVVVCLLLWLSLKNHINNIIQKEINNIKKEIKNHINNIIQEEINNIKKGKLNENISKQTIDFIEKIVSKKIEEYKKLIEEEILKIHKQISDIKTEKKEIETSSYRYLKGQNGKIFSRVDQSAENSFFRIVFEKGDEAEFEFCGNAAEAIANRVFSENICEIISGAYQNAHHVETVERGIVKHIGDQWQVIKRVKIRLY